MLKYRLKCKCVCECVLYLVSCVALHTVNYCEACLTVTSCLGHGVFWGHTLTHIHTNGCTSCSIWPDLALVSLRSILSIFLCLHCIRVCLWLSFIGLVFVLWWKTTMAIKPQVSTNSVYFLLLMWYCTPVTALKWPKSHHLLSPKLLGFSLLLFICLTSSLPWGAPYWAEWQ